MYGLSGLLSRSVPGTRCSGSLCLSFSSLLRLVSVRLCLFTVLLLVVVLVVVVVVVAAVVVGLLVGVVVVVLVVLVVLRVVAVGGVGVLPPCRVETRNSVRKQVSQVGVSYRKSPYGLAKVVASEQ